MIGRSRKIVHCHKPNKGKGTNMCGIIGVVSKTGDVINDAIDLLNAENNRGEQACGAAAFDGKRIRCYRGKGLVAKVFDDENYEKWGKLTGSACIAHTLYSTIGRGGEKKQPQMFQPLIFNFHGRRGALAHNGNLVRVEGLREKARKAGYRFQSEASDTEVIAALLSTAPEKDFLEALKGVLKKIEGKGAFALVILFKDKIIGVRDSNGVRPLCLGKRNGEVDSYILASEDSVFPALKSARFIREIAPGELIVLGGEGVEKSFKWTDKTSSKACVCELIYFSGPASTFFGRSVYSFRAKAGEILAREHPVKADIIVPVPNSGNDYSDGFSSVSGISTRRGIVKSKYARRTFMQTRDVDRGKSQRRALRVLPDVLGGKDICLTEDSLFRGNVGRAVVSLVRIHGKAREVHLRICSPPVRHCCHLGLDTSTKEELLATQMTTDEIRDNVVHSDSLEYLSLEGLKEALRSIGLSPDDFCLGCFTGEYPVEPPEDK
jgi:amidophosphoribosyltransferase